MMTLTPQLQNIAIKKRASQPSSIREPDVDLQKLVDKIEQAEVTIKLEGTENLKLQNVNNIQTTTSQINHIYDSDTELAEKNHSNIKNSARKIQNLKADHHSKNSVTIAVHKDIALLNADKNNKIIRTNHKNTENQINFFTNT